jgi:hypothetical protein
MQESAPPPTKKPRTLPKLDSRLLWRVLKAAKCDFDDAAAALEELGYTTVDAHRISELVLEDAVLMDAVQSYLNEATVSRSPIKQEDALARIETPRPLSAGTMSVEALQKEDDALSMKGAEAAGMTAEEMQRFNGLAAFAGHGMVKTIDFAVGTMSMSLMAMERRLRWIEAEVFSKSDVRVTRTIIGKSGPMEIEVPLWTPEQLIAWQEQATKLSVAIAGSTNVAISAKKVQIEAMQVASQMNRYAQEAKPTVRRVLKR